MLELDGLVDGHHPRGILAVFGDAGLAVATTKGDVLADRTGHETESEM